MNISQIDSKIKELQDKKEKLIEAEKAKQSFINVKDLMRIPELKIEVTKPVKWIKPCNKIVAPKGFRKIKVWELWFILDGSRYMDEFLKDFKGKYNWFWCEQTNYANKNNYSSGLVLGWGLGLVSDVDNLAGSNGRGRVVFTRDLPQKSGIKSKTQRGGE